MTGLQSPNVSAQLPGAAPASLCAMLVPLATALTWNMVACSTRLSVSTVPPPSTRSGLPKSQTTRMSLPSMAAVDETVRAASDTASHAPWSAVRVMPKGTVAFSSMASASPMVPAAYPRTPPPQALHQPEVDQLASVNGTCPLSTLPTPEDELRQGNESASRNSRAISSNAMRALSCTRAKLSPAACVWRLVRNRASALP